MRNDGANTPTVAMTPPSGPASNLALNLLSNLAPVLLMVPLGYLGYRLWAENGENPEGVPAAA